MKSGTISSPTFDNSDLAHDVLQNDFRTKEEKDPRSFILSCIIGNTTVSNALTDLGVLISVMSFSMFKRLGLRTPRPDSMVIEMEDKSMQSPKGIVENILVKIDKFIFSVDFVILDIVEDNKVPIILGKPMLTTAHARIGVFDRKISMDVGTKKVVFNVNEGKTPLSVCVLNDFQVPEEFEETKSLEEFLMNDDINEDLGDFLEEIDLLAKIGLGYF
ncbi:retrovirus-related pol polyprotein from transposon TNT 1-94 [Tanacetum coccineum]|uniref:Retrovirus-related pol polyprotein from transposon TNT 1-94 n=1 Tax=Tanacetum coccineum TaxID=301880 RepID=A0ABQ5GFR5_9ASTR